jgi:hypothetical protein
MLLRYGNRRCPARLSSPDPFSFPMGCIGLMYIRLNQDPKNGGPWSLPGTKAFTNLDSALEEQKKRKECLKEDEMVVLYAIQTSNTKFVKDAVRPGSKEYDLSKVNNMELGSFNFASAAQTEDGIIRFWEWMPSGESSNPNLTVKHGAELPKDDGHGNRFPGQSIIYVVVTIKKHRHAMRPVK